jgi:hypothetical protein
MPKFKKGERIVWVGFYNGEPLLEGFASEIDSVKSYPVFRTKNSGLAYFEDVRKFKLVHIKPRRKMI